MCYPTISFSGHTSNKNIEEQSKKKKAIMLKSIVNDEDSNELEEGDEDKVMVMIMRKF